jgi:hypothetical protein
MHEADDGLMSGSCIYPAACIVQNVVLPDFPNSSHTKLASIKLSMRSLIVKVTACLLFIACALWYARSHFYRDPGSAFFDKARAYEQRYSQHRKTEVQRYIDSFDVPGSQIVQPEAGSNATLCVSLSSVRRERAQYLEVCFPCRSC